jgi:excisionase family DNA binding protein
VIDGGKDRLLSVRQVAARLGVCTATVYLLCERNELAHIRVLNAIRIAPADLAEFIDARRKPQAPWAAEHSGFRDSRHPSQWMSHLGERRARPRALESS